MNDSHGCHRHKTGTVTDFEGPTQPGTVGGLMCSMPTVTKVNQLDEQLAVGKGKGVLCFALVMFKTFLHSFGQGLNLLPQNAQLDLS